MSTSFDQLLNNISEVGFVTESQGWIVLIQGLPGARINEEIRFETGQVGRVSTILRTHIEVILISIDTVLVGTRAARLGDQLKIEVGPHLLGRTLNSLGEVVGEIVSGGATNSESKDDAKSKQKKMEIAKYPLDVAPTGITGRKKIDTQLFSGVSLLDLMIPIGKGQRELVIGDRKTGKSHLLSQIILAQAASGTICIYAGIGKKKTDIIRAEEFFKKSSHPQNIIILGSTVGESAGQIFIAPYTAMAIAEYFRDNGRHVLLVLDDLSTHAKFYRELSLIARKFPGRDSYPGDIFHIHSKLLERAGNYMVGDSVASITCLPTVETVQGDITGYIQTNLMSMTDGHIYFDSDLFFRGRRPAINPFVSVTRVGRQTQSLLQRDAGRVMLELFSNYEKTQAFLRFGAEIGENSRQILMLGEKMLQFFNQPPYTVIPIELTLVMVAALLSGIWDGKNFQKILDAYHSDSEYAKLIVNLNSNTTSFSNLIEKVRKATGQLFSKYL